MSEHCSDAHPLGRHRISQTAYGRVLRCKGCGALELHFGNLVLMVARVDLDGLIQRISAYDTASSLEVDEVTGRPVGEDRAVFYLGSTGVGFTFNRAEISDLHRLLVGTRLMLDLSGRHP